MDTASTRNEIGKKGVLVTELARSGVLFNVDKASSQSAGKLERSLRDLKMNDESSPRSQDSLSYSYESMLTDYITTLTIATVFLFSYNPWAALFWPPYYYHHHNKT
jgi:hypothetical protein